MCFTGIIITRISILLQSSLFLNQTKHRSVPIKYPVLKLDPQTRFNWHFIFHFSKHIPQHSTFFLCLQALSKNFDPDSIVSVELEHLGLISINDPSQFTIRVTGGDDAELAVSVQGKLYFNFCWAVGTQRAGGQLPPPPLTYISAGMLALFEIGG